MIKPNFFVLFDKGEGIFKPGEKVVGKCCIDSKEKDETTDIEIQAMGQAYVHWTETTHYSTGTGKDRKTATRTVNYDSEHQYLNHTIFDSGGPFTLNAGHKEFPFKFELPFGCPCTFNSHYGSVTYGFKAVIHRPNLQHAEEHLIQFQVDSAFDFGSIPAAIEPADNSYYLTLCCCCCRSGPISLTLTIKRSGCVRGEYIELQSRIHNKSNRTIKNCTMSLLQVRDFIPPHIQKDMQISLRFRNTVTCLAEGNTRTTCDSIAECTKSDSIEPGKTDNWEGNLLTVPLTAVPTILGGFCSFIQVNHKVKLAVKISGPAKDASVEVPIMVGAWFKEGTQKKEDKSIISFFR